MSLGGAGFTHIAWMSSVMLPATALHHPLSCSSSTSFFKTTSTNLTGRKLVNMEKGRPS